MKFLATFCHWTGLGIKDKKQKIFGAVLFMLSSFFLGLGFQQGYDQSNVQKLSQFGLKTRFCGDGSPVLAHLARIPSSYQSSVLELGDRGFRLFQSCLCRDFTEAPSHRGKNSCQALKVELMDSFGG